MLLLSVKDSVGGCGVELRYAKRTLGMQEALCPSKHQNSVMLARSRLFLLRDLRLARLLCSKGFRLGGSRM